MDRKKVIELFKDSDIETLEYLRKFDNSILLYNTIELNKHALDTPEYYEMRKNTFLMLGFKIIDNYTLIDLEEEK